jgi:hypothetical protein
MQTAENYNQPHAMTASRQTKRVRMNKRIIILKFWSRSQQSKHPGPTCNPGLNDLKAQPSRELSSWRAREPVLNQEAAEGAAPRTT